MEYQIRLADRKGVLTGTKMSVIQDYALQIMMWLEGRDRGEQNLYEFKMAHISHDPEWTSIVFPELEDTSTTNERLDKLEGEVEYDLTGFQEMTLEDMQNIMGQVR